MKKFDKLVVTVRSALQAKYKEDYPRLYAILQTAVRADKNKGLVSRLIFLDDRTTFGPSRIKALDPAKAVEKDYKDVIDALYNLHNPDYILIFGAIDIVPQQKLKNFLYQVDGDDDKWIPSDLPYACNAPFSRDLNSFLSPVRAVGRIPDVNGISDMDLVEASFRNTSHFTPKSKEDLLPYFSASAAVWTASTRLSLKHIFGGDGHVNNVPPGGPAWKKAQLKPLSHFYNCHGALSTPTWYGQQGATYPPALHSSDLTGNIEKYTVVASECCYGAQLYKPAASGLPGSLPICNAYFKQGAVAFLGSSTIAYGPPSGNEQADLVTQYFFIGMLSGASTGRALLEARQKYILNHGPDLSPVDLKTIAQFNLLGDPSLQMVKDASNRQKRSAGIIGAKAFDDRSRKERRKYLLSKGLALAGFVNQVQTGKPASAPKAKGSIEKLLTRYGLRHPVGKTFTVKQNKRNSKAFSKKGMHDAKFHIFIEQKKKGSFSQQLLSIKEIGGKIVNVQCYARR